MQCRSLQPRHRFLNSPTIHRTHGRCRDRVPRPSLYIIAASSLHGKRYFASSAGLANLQAVPTLPSWDLDAFRQRAFVPQLPALLPQDASQEPPAARSWFESESTEESSRRLDHDYLGTYADTTVPLELTRTDATGAETFERFNGPLKLFLDWMRQQQGQQGAAESMSRPPSSPRLYLAQCPISDLPAPLQADLPTPPLALHAGKGDIYDANIWIGTPPTYTPLHRDPNPNFFLQLAGAKVVRLFPPDVGRAIFTSVQKRLGRRSGSSVFRGEEMMQGEEREMLEREVWKEEEEEENRQASDLARDGYEATVEQGNALFIPLGWWHSIKGVRSGTTASVNWWFR